ncbi:hypothetical protein [Streptomyces sp. NBC_01320]|uniref:hypothetical protein n=1 Tax=Streptomyces sp. NBC_01320 TaxID=2903824 RepID=UPI002E1633E6|nr:hypothetical protein OG395_26255 [Streptomyces sp. NBC_01320]
MVGEDVDDVAAGDHVAGGEAFEGLALGCIAGVDAAVAPDAQEDLRFDGLDRAAYGGVRLLPAGDASAWPGRRMSSRGATVCPSGGTWRRVSAPPASGWVRAWSRAAARRKLFQVSARAMPS